MIVSVILDGALALQTTPDLGTLANDDDDRTDYTSELYIKIGDDPGDESYTQLMCMRAYQQERLVEWVTQ